MLLSTWRVTGLVEEQQLLHEMETIPQVSISTSKM